MENNKPFSMDYVLKVTTKHMRKSVDISIKKTLERLPEFASDEVKSKEVFTTVATLQSLKNQLDSFQNTK